MLLIHFFFVLNLFLVKKGVYVRFSRNDEENVDLKESKWRKERKRKYNNFFVLFFSFFKEMDFLL